MISGDTASISRRAKSALSSEQKPLRAPSHKTDNVSKTLRRASLVYITGLFLLDLNSPYSGLKIWNVAWACLAFISITMAFLAYTRPGNQNRPRLFLMDAAYLIYVAYCFISAIWSVTPADTLTQAAFALIGWLATLAIRAMSKAQLINLVVRATFIVATLSFAAIILLPGMAFQPAPSGDLPELRGIYDHQLRLGLLMGIVVGIMLIARLNGDLWGSLRTTRPRLILIFVVILVCFIAALARLNSFFIVLALALTFGLMRKSVLRLASLVAIAAASLLLIFDWNSLLRYAGDRGVDLTLTGRTNVWATTQALSEKAGLFGYGLGSFTDPSFDAYWQYYRAPSAHNSFLQANFETGVVGLTLLAVLVVTHLATSYSAGRTSGKVSYSFFLVLAVALCSITAVVYAGKPTAVFELMLLFLAVERQDATSLGTVSARRVCTSAREPAIP